MNAMAMYRRSVSGANASPEAAIIISARNLKDCRPSIAGVEPPYIGFWFDCARL
jgi:hypothetical protein